MYKLVQNTLTNTISGVLRIADNTFIPLDPANTDYANFKKQINADEAQLEDADGNLMTAEQAKAYVATLPQEIEYAINTSTRWDDTGKRSVYS